VNRLAILITAVWLLTGSAAMSGAAQNPFTGQKEAAPPVPRLFSSNTVLAKIALWQFQVREQMAALVHQAKQEKSLRPLALLILLAVAYGSLHAAGPGHGKAIAISYMITRKPSYAQGLLFGAAVALIHGVAGIAFVLIVAAVLQIGIAGTLGQVTYVSQIVSYSLIVVIGVAIVVNANRSRRSRGDGGGQALNPKSRAGYWAAALAIGIVPCPGVVMVALFSVSMGLLGLGVVLGLAISLGMTLTIAAVITSVVAGKKAAVQRMDGRGRRMRLVETVCESGGGVLVTTLGIVFLAATI
jgi:ABC-type nickel/cobalt efflux system permease component RcnA